MKADMAAKTQASATSKASTTPISVAKRTVQADSSSGTSLKKTCLSDRGEEISFFMSSPDMNDNGLMKPDRGIHTVLEALDHVKAIFQEIELANQQIRVAVKKAEEVAGVISVCLSGAGYILQQQQVDRLVIVKQNMDDFATFAKSMNKGNMHCSIKLEE